MEVEAKLVARNARVLAAVARRKRLGRYVLDAVGTRELETVYLDTASGDLTRRHIALRVRRSKHRVEVTLKLPGDVSRGVHRRPESTWRLRRMPRLPFRPSGRIARELRRWDRAAPLLPLVGTRIHRRALVVRRPGGGAPVAEIDLDRVEFFQPDAPAAAPRGSARFHEIEVELLGGDERDLRALVRTLRRRYPLRASRLSKLERALRWARNATGARSAVKSARRSRR